MVYLVRLTDGTVFLGERPWYYYFLDDSGSLRFKNVQGQHAPLVGKGEKLIVPKTSILYRVEQRRQG